MKNITVYKTSNGSNLYTFCHGHNSINLTVRDIHFLESIGYIVGLGN